MIALWPRSTPRESPRKPSPSFGPVKVEFYVADPAAAGDYRSELRVARLSPEALARRPIALTVSQAIVPTALLTEVFADKIYAVAGREYLKYRDVFDLWWLDQQGAVPGDAELLHALDVRRAIYPRGPAIDSGLADTLRARAAEIVTGRRVSALSADLSRWLALSGSALLAQSEHARSIAEAAAAHLRKAADLVDARGRVESRPRGR